MQGNDGAHGVTRPTIKGILLGVLNRKSETIILNQNILGPHFEAFVLVFPNHGGKKFQ
jgi:hypothetical protein